MEPNKAVDQTEEVKVPKEDVKTQEEVKELLTRLEELKVTKVAVPQSSYGERTRIAALLQEDFEKWIGTEVKVCGWARTIRDNKAFAFIELNDGSCFNSLQIVVDQTITGFAEVIKTGVGASFAFKGLVVKSPGKGQKVELQVSKNETHFVKVFGSAEQGIYPLAKKNHSVEYLRSICHLRPRTNLIGAVARIRNSLAYATHMFFQSRGFLYVHTPIVTASDCEGAGEMFQVTTVLPPHNKGAKDIPVTKPAENAEPIVDYKKDFFGKPAFLTVSGQLQVENFACALSDVYTFGPTFRAENSHTSRHLAEFWMIEPEMCFADIYDDMHLAESYLKFLIKHALENNMEDLKFFDQRVEKGLVERLKNISESEFARVTYTEAIEIVTKAQHGGKVKFENSLKWGDDMFSEHERYLAEKHFQKPVIVYNYPKDIKAFYMKLNEDNKTVAAMDVLVPKIGEVIGGSQREERLDVLDQRIKEMGLEIEGYWWYRDLRKFGTVPHAGFGLGFERLVMMVTGVENIRDVIPYPRYPGHAEF